MVIKNITPSTEKGGRPASIKKFKVSNVVSVGGTSSTSKLSSSQQNWKSSGIQRVMTPSASAAGGDDSTKSSAMAKLPLDRIKFSPKQNIISTTQSASVNNFDAASGNMSARSALKKIKLSRH